MISKSKGIFVFNTKNYQIKNSDSNYNQRHNFLSESDPIWMAMQKSRFESDVPNQFLTQCLPHGPVYVFLERRACLLFRLIPL